MVCDKRSAQASRSKRPAAAALGAHAKPRGKVPRGMQWDYEAGKWRPAPAEPASSASEAHRHRARDAAHAKELFGSTARSTRSRRASSRSASTSRATSTASPARCARASLAPAHAARLALSGPADRRACARAAQDYWVAPAGNDTIDQVAKLFDEWGWKVTVYDGAE